MDSAAHSAAARAGLGVVQTLRTCGGHALVVARCPERALGELETSSREAVELELGTMLAELDARGAPVPEIVLMALRREDSAWIAWAIPWLEARGRGVRVRTRVRLERELVELLATRGGLVLLELASHRPEVQGAVLGPSAEPAASLLLHAQHLSARGVRAAAWVGPLLGGLHEGPEATRPLWRHIAAADIRSGHVEVGRLTPARAARLAQVLSAAEWSSVRRAHGLSPDPAEPVGPGAPLGPLGPRGALGPQGMVPDAGVKLPAPRACLLHAAAAAEAEDAGVDLRGCGCGLGCALRGSAPSGRRPYVSLATSDLFGRTG